MLVHDTDGRYSLDPLEPPFAEWEVERAAKWLDGWDAARRSWNQPPAGRCPHEQEFCDTRELCIERVAWWFRYLREIEGLA